MTQQASLVSRLEVIEAIQLLKARYFRGMDTKDGELLRTVFAADVELDYRGAATDPITGVNLAPGTTEELLHGRDECVGRVLAALDGVMSLHRSGLVEVTVVSDTEAEAIVPMTDRLVFSDGPFREMLGWGHYFDVFSLDPANQRWELRQLRLVRQRVDFLPQASSST